MDCSSKKLKVRLFGPFLVMNQSGEEVKIAAKKQRIILAALLMAPEGLQSRTQLESMLWSLTGREQAQGNLRQAVMALRRALNADGAEVFHADHTNVWLDPAQFEILGNAETGEFLEGINLPFETGFNAWVKTHRKKNDLSAARPLQQFDMSAEAGLRPTIAVLPFLSTHAESDVDIVGDMLSDSVIHTLSRCSLMNVVSHLSSRRLDARLISIDAVEDTLSAHYVVTGRIRTLSDRSLVETEIINVANGQIVGGFQDSFSAAEFLSSEMEIIEAITTEVGRSIFSSSLGTAISTHSLGSVASHDLMMSGIFLMHQLALSSFSLARKYLEETSMRVPNSSIPLAWLSKWYLLSVIQGWSTDIAKDSALARDYVARALDINPTCSFSLSVDGFVQNNLFKNYSEAMSRFDQALALNPNNPLSWLLKGTLLAFMDQGDEAVGCTTRARKLSPIDPHKYFFDSLSATAALSNKDFGEALRLAERSLKANPHHTSTQRVIVIAHAERGEIEEAREAAKTLLKMDPSLTVNSYIARHPAANFQTGRDWAKALETAGIPKS